MIKKFTLGLIISLSVSILMAQTPMTVAENFNIKTAHGTTLNLFNILDGGQYVVIDFFNVTCGPCQIFAPDFQQSYEHFGSNEYETFYMGISYSGDNTMIIEWDQTYGLSYPTVSGTEGGGYNVHIDWGVQTVPTIVLIAPNHDIIGQIHIPAYEPSVTVIDSMLMSHGLTPMFTGDFQAEAKKDDVLKVYPNPASDYIQISANTNQNSEYRIEVYSLTGQNMITQNLKGSGEQSETINLDYLKSGLYFVALIENDQIIDRRKINVIK